MLTEKEILTYFSIERIERSFSESGQKQVVLVQSKKYGKSILKIVEKISLRTKREIDIIKINNFSCVPQILEYDSFSFSGHKGIYIIEEYIEGYTLREILNKQKRLSYKEVVNLAKQVLEIMLQLENKNIVHRDIKPENIIRSKKDGKWWLIDFGIARALDMESLTYTNAFEGPYSPGYAAPELFLYVKNEIDNRSDIFSLGIVLYEAITGVNPFIVGEYITIEQIKYNTINIIPPKVVLKEDKSGKLLFLIESFMQKYRSRRPQTVKQAYNWLLEIIIEEE